MKFCLIATKKETNNSKFTQTGRQKEEDGKTLLCDKSDRPVTYVFCGDLHL